MTKKGGKKKWGKKIQLRVHLFIRPTVQFRGTRAAVTRPPRSRSLQTAPRVINHCTRFEKRRKTILLCGQKEKIYMYIHFDYVVLKKRYFSKELEKIVFLDIPSDLGTIFFFLTRS